MKNVMKKLAGLLMVLSVALLAGCSDSSDSSNEAVQVAKTYTVSGKISIGNAVPANVAKSIATSFAGAGTNARSATTDFDMAKITCGTPKWEVKATNTSGEIYGEVNSEEMLYSINLPTGTWDLELRLQGENDTNTFEELFYEQKELEVPGDSGAGPDIFLSPKNFSTNINGALDLTITDETSKINTVTCELNYLTEENPDIEAAIDEKLKEPQKFSGDSVTIKLDEVPAGCYEATFTFKDASDNKLYACKENITVFSGWTTDTWLGEGAHLKKNTEGKIEFKITEALLYDEAETVPDTNMVLYDVNNGVYNYCLSDTATATVPASPEYSSSSNSFVFDNNGKFYTLLTTSSDGVTKYYIKTDNDKVADGQVEIPASYSPSRLAYDSKTNIIYLVSIDRTTMELRQLPKLASEGTVSDVTQVYCSGYSEAGVDEFTNCYYKMCIVHNDVVYSIVRGDRGESYVQPALVIAKISETSTTTPATGVLILNEDMKNSIGWYEDITDMLYQDGAVYMLYRDVSGTTSRGALIRYDVKFGGIKVLGLTTNEVKGDDFANVKLGVYDGGYSVLSRDTNEPIVFSGTKTWEYGSKNYFLKDFIAPLRTPASLSDTPETVKQGFFGPVKFIAIKPKELVIADDGIAFYTDNDLLKYKNVNRIVTVDLESFSIIDEPSLVNVHFNGDISGITNVISLSTTESQDAWREGKDVLLPDPGIDGSGTTLYYTNSNGATVTNRLAVDYGIPCGD